MSDKLKTLNELTEKKVAGYSGLIFKEDVKAEAVKRVKNCKNMIKTETVEFLCGYDFKGFCEGCKRDMWVHNLTEKDLK